MREKIGLGILFIFAMVVGFGGNSALAGVTAKLTTAPNVPPAVKHLMWNECPDVEDLHGVGSRVVGICWRSG